MHLSVMQLVSQLQGSVAATPCHLVQLCCFEQAVRTEFEMGTANGFFVKEVEHFVAFVNEGKGVHLLGALLRMVALQTICRPAWWQVCLRKHLVRSLVGACFRFNVPYLDVCCGIVLWRSDVRLLVWVWHLKVCK